MTISSEVTKRHQLLIKLWKEQERNEEDNRLLIHRNESYLATDMDSEKTTAPTRLKKV